VNDLTDQIRAACARVAARARYVSIEREAIAAHAAGLADSAHSAGAPPAVPDAAAHLLEGTPEELSAFWLTLDAINFGSGWFPTLRKRRGRSGYHTVAGGVRDRFATNGHWQAEELAAIGAAEVAQALGQDPGHELMELFARSLNDLGRRVARDHCGRFQAVVDDAGWSAVKLATRLAGWECFADVSTYDGFAVPFYKRAQIAAADLADTAATPNSSNTSTHAGSLTAAAIERASDTSNPAGVAPWHDRHRLTMFADNLVPHVLRLDGILRFTPGLVARIDRGELIEHGSPEEVEIRACALHAVELITAARPDMCAVQVDRILWNRGGGASYKSSPRHRSRCTAY
jgi:hypothetical protein